MAKRVALVLIPFVALGSALTVGVFLGGSSNPAMALPESAQARYFDITVATTDGRQVELPEKVVTCPLDLTISAAEGLYRCPAPYDIDALLKAAPQVLAIDPASGFGPGSLASTPVLIEIDAATLVYGLPANSWQTVQIEYGATLTSTNVLLGEELTSGQSGHIENTAWPDFSRGVHPSYFYYRANTNGSGFMGTEWLARGTQ
jgi:hypothetical protein